MAKQHFKAEGRSRGPLQTAGVMGFEGAAWRTDHVCVSELAFFLRSTTSIPRDILFLMDRT